MPDQTLAQMVRAKYPGAYDDMTDSQLESAVKAKYPGVYDDLPTTKETQPPPAEPQHPMISAATDFAKGVLSNVNPIEIAKGIYGSVVHPVDTIEGLGRAQLEQFTKGKAAYDQGRYSEAIGHALAGVLPVVGPAAADIGEAIGSGQDTAYNVGKGIGLTALMAPSAIGAAAGKAATALKATGSADVAEAAGASRVAQAITPTVGANKVRFANMAQDVGERLATEPGIGAVTRGGFAENIGAKLQQATDALDQATNERQAGRPINTKPILAALNDARDELTAQPFNADRISFPQRGSQSPTGLVKTAATGPMGQDVVPTPNAGRVAQIDNAISEVKALGPQASYDALKTIRQAYDKVAKVKYSPSLTQDFLARQGEASGAADVTGVLRDTLAQADPATAKANAEYSFWRKANDVVQAAEEVDRARPTVGRNIMARSLGALAGGETAGGLGAVIGGMIGPSIDAAANTLSTRLIVGRQLGALANAIRSGDAAGVQKAASIIRALNLSTTKKVPATPQASPTEPVLTARAGGSE